jgi:papain like cysteine protease AvrRpt2/permuted papain-like amidase YaeF/Yiix C92 family enzyme
VPAQIRPNRLEVTDRFPMLGFTIRTDRSPARAEVVVATDPSLFRPENKSKRTASTFFSTRSTGVLDIARGEAVYLLPPEVLARFIGQQRLYVALATTYNNNGGPHVDVLPTDGSPYVSISGLTNRSLRRVRMIPSRQERAAGYNGNTNGATLEWAGDAATPGATSAADAPRGAKPSTPTGAPPADYDDGFGPLPAAQQPQLAPPPNGQASANGSRAATATPSSRAAPASAAIPAASAKALDAPTLTVSNDRRNVTPPSVRRLPTWETALVEAALSAFAGPLGPVITALPAAARAGGVSIGLGPAVGAGVGAGGSLGVGVVFGPDGGIGVYGSAEFDTGFIASISATAQITIVRGGIESFNGWSVAAAISGGEEIVGGAAALFDTSGTFQGVSFQLGVGAGLTPIDFYVAVQRSVGTQVATTQALAVRISSPVRVLDLPALTISGSGQPVTPPSVRRLPTWEATIARGALAAFSGPLGPVVAALPAAASATGVSIGLGPAVSAGLGGGIGLGVGVIFGPDGGFGVYGSAEFDAGFLASISATGQITIVRGGIESFNNWGTAFAISGGEGVVGGASALFDMNGAFQGVTFSLGAGAGLTPVDFYVAVQRSIATQLALAQATMPGLKMPGAIRSVAAARVLATDIPLDPGNGGMSIGPDALEIGDIILSTTSATVSGLIRFATSSDVSHAMLYVGQGGQVIDATGAGVRLRPLTEALADATVAVAFRYPGLTDDQKGIIADKAAELIGRSYNYVGIVRQAQFRVHSTLCNVLPDAQAGACRTFFGGVDLGRGSSTEFFCSQLIVEAYQQAGVPLTETPPSWSSPDDLAQLALRSGALAYVGHLKAPPYSSRQSIWEAIGLSVATAQAAQPARTQKPRPRALANESFTINWDEVELIAQPTNFSCWAAAGAMVVGWKELVSLSPDSLAQICSRTTATGLDPAQVQQFANEVGLSYEAPACYSVDGFRQLLENYGPLWIAASVPGLHAIVVTGMYSDGTNTFVRVSDPWDRTVGTPGAPGAYLKTHTTGSRYILKWEDFVREYEAAATDYSSVNLQILHADSVGNHVPNRGASTPAGYAQALRKRRQAQQLAADPSAAPAPPVAAAMPATRRVDTGSAANARWSLEQYIGLRRPASGAGDANAVPVERAIQLDDWPLLRVADVDVSLPITVAWRYTNGAVGDVSVRAGAPATTAGWTLATSAEIVDGPDSPSVTAVTVNLRTVFSQTGRSDIVASTQLTLFGDGTYNRQDRWVQQAEAVVA